MPKLPPKRAGLALHIPGGSLSPDVEPEGAARATVCRGLEAHSLIFRNQGGRWPSVGKMLGPKMISYLTTVGAYLQAVTAVRTRDPGPMNNLDLELNNSK